MLGIILNILATFGVFSQFFLEHMIKKTRSKKWVGFEIMLLATIGIGGGFFVQDSDNQKLSNSLDSIKTTNNELRVLLEEREKDITTVRDQNDSLKIMLADFKKRQEEFIIISEIFKIARGIPSPGGTIRKGILPVFFAQPAVDDHPPSR